MTRLRRASLLCLIALGLPAFAAEPPPCVRLERALEATGNVEPAVCRSGRDLAKLRATLPSGLKLAAARGLYVDDDRGYRDLDPRVDAVNLDRLADAGVGGALLLAGTLRLHGRVRYEPNAGWELAFLPDRVPGRAETPLARALATIVLDRDDGALAVEPPTEFAGAVCWEATADARATDLMVLIDDSEPAGARPLSIRFDRVRDFRACAAAPL